MLRIRDILRKGIEEGTIRCLLNGKYGINGKYKGKYGKYGEQTFRN